MATLQQKEEWRSNKRGRNMDFLCLTTEQQAELTSSHPTQCHRWMNFIPDAILQTIDPDDKKELARWNRIFHYQKHPFHRPPPMPVETLYDQRILYRGHTQYGQCVTEIDTSEEPTVGQWVLDSGKQHGVVLISAYDRLWRAVT